MTAPFNVLTEMYVDAAWVDISADVLNRDGHTIKRGKSDYASQASPSQVGLSLKNTGGKYSPRNPMSQYHRKIGRNTPLRVSRLVDTAFEASSSASGTGDLSWSHPGVAPTGVLVYVWQYDTAAGQIDSVTYGGVPMTRVIFGLFVMGGFNTVGYAYWLNRDIPAGAQTVVVDTNAVKNRYAAVITVSGGDTAEIDLMTQAYSNATPTTNPFALASPPHRAMLFGTLLSDLDDGSTINPQGGYTQLDEADIGTETVSLTRSATNPAGAYSVGWTQTPAAHWGIMGVAVRAVWYRAWTEISSLPPKWDLTNTSDVWVPVEAAGLLRRLGQGTDPAETGLRAYMLAQTGLFRYWPLDGARGTSYSLDIAPVWGATTNYRFSGEGGNGNFAYGEDLGTSYLGTGMAFFNSDAWPMRGNVATGYANWAFDFVFQQPGNGVMGSFTAVMYDYAGTSWSLNFSAGVAQVSFDDGVIGPIGFSPTGILPGLLDTDPHHVRLKLLKSGADTLWTLYLDGVIIDTGTQTGYAVFGLSVFRLFMSRAAGQQYVNLAHLAVWSDAASEIWPSAAAVTSAARGYDGEAAGTRIVRITSLAAIPTQIVGDPADTTIMGPQHSEAKLTQLRDAENTDLGILGEPRDRFGLMYRTRTSLYNQAARATLDYSLKQLAPPLEPVDDDQATKNDVTVTRRDGGSYRAISTSGRLSTLDPPNGVGRYKDEVTVNVQTDDQLPGIAGWLLNIGTLDEARFPSVVVDLRAAALRDDPVLTAAVLNVDIGDRLVITKASVVNIYDDVSVLVIGYSEELSPFTHKITFNCVPEAPYNVAAYGTASGSGPDKYDTDGSALVAGVNSSALSLSVKSTGPAGVVWTNDAAEFPFDIRCGGERMTVTNITGATSPQTFTVVRHVNGVVKAQVADEPVALWNTPRYGL